MLVYVALQLLNYLVTGPWKDPNGHNFPQSAPFTPSQTLPHTIWGTPFPPGLFIAFALAIVFWIVMSRSEFGLGIRVVGDAPKAARYAGYDANKMVWQTLLISGGMAGLAGRSGGGDARRPAQSRLSLGLWLHRDHRLLPRPAASARRGARGRRARGHLCRRAGRANRRCMCPTRRRAFSRRRCCSSFWRATCWCKRRIKIVWSQPAQAPQVARSTT